MKKLLILLPLVLVACSSEPAWKSDPIIVESKSDKELTETNRLAGLLSPQPMAETEPKWRSAPIVVPAQQEPPQPKPRLVPVEPAIEPRLISGEPYVPEGSRESWIDHLGPYTQKSLNELLATDLVVFQTVVRIFVPEGPEEWEKKRVAEYKKTLKLAHEGWVVAQSNLGVIYHYGRGVPRNKQEALKWCRKAAERGLAQAQHNLGWLYHEGEGVVEDYAEARKWFIKAADQNLVQAQYTLSSMYSDGSPTLEDYREAVKWLYKAAKQAHRSSQYRLGEMYRNGVGVSQDHVEAYKWFLLASIDGWELAETSKESLRKQLASVQIEEAQRRAKAFQAGEEQRPKVEKENIESVAEQPVLAQGTGFLFTRSGFVTTNYHVVSGGKTVRIYFPKADREFDATVELKDINNDLVVLRIKNFPYDDFFSQEVPFSVKRSSGVQLGEEVFTLGFPLGELLGKSAKFSDGTISSLSGLLGSANLFQINNPVQPGNSGGPLFDGDGNLIGIVVAMLDAKFFYENLDTIPQNVNFAIKSDYLINLISMLPDGSSILSRKGMLEDKPQEEQIKNLVPYIITVSVR